MKDNNWACLDIDYKPKTVTFLNPTEDLIKRIEMLEDKVRYLESVFQELQELP